MSKIEELTELLVNKINTFEKGIERLEKVGDKLNSTKISIDIKEYRSLMEDYHSKIRVILNSQERIYVRYEKLLKNARIYPNWAVIVFIISLIFGIVSTSFILLTKI